MYVVVGVDFKHTHFRIHTYEDSGANEVFLSCPTTVMLRVELSPRVFIFSHLFAISQAACLFFYFLGGLGGFREDIIENTL